MVTDEHAGHYAMAVHVRIYMLDEVPAPHSPSGGAAMLHPIGAQLIPTVQENAKVP